ncbi:hypothetical protein [Celeribacter sp.]|uniref:hypothetical protein n=1 Tax=Celeribacter sp. TaxID=1890673 RepID=UPI003A92FA23
MTFSRLLVILSLFVLTACGAAEPRWASEAEVSRARYVSNEPTSLTLFTVVGKRNGSGAHSGLMVNAPSQRAMFDPAGTFKHPHLPERNDVIFGMSDAAVAFYVDYHARETFNVIEQTIEVSPQVAEFALARIQSYGAVPKAQCARSISSILASIPGFQDAPSTMFPNKLTRYFEAKGATSRLHMDDSPDDNSGLIQAPDLRLRGDLTVALAE